MTEEAVVEVAAGAEQVADRAATIMATGRPTATTVRTGAAPTMQWCQEVRDRV